MGVERSIRTIALRDVVLGGDDDYHLRARLRWYSKTFSTPLHVVETKIPLTDVLRAFWEEHYEALRDGDDKQAQEALHQEREMLTLTAEELAQVQRDGMEEDNDAILTLERLQAQEVQDAGDVPDLAGQAAALAETIETFDLSNLESDPIGLLDDLESQSLGDG